MTKAKRTACVVLAALCCAGAIVFLFPIRYSAADKEVVSVTVSIDYENASEEIASTAGIADFVEAFSPPDRPFPDIRFSPPRRNGL